MLLTGSDQNYTVSNMMEPAAYTKPKDHNWGVKWTPEEDARLLRGMEQYGEDWRRVSELVVTRDLGNMLCVN
jgi:hypothetical protein